MAEPDLVLEFKIAEGRSPNLENVARALLAWNDGVQAAVAAIDPSVEMIVELVEVEHGSQRFKQLFRRIESAAKAIDEGSQEYPYIWKHTKTLASLIAVSVAGAGAVVMMTPTPKAPAEEMQVLDQIRDELKDDIDLRRSTQSFFSILQEDPAFKELRLFESNDAQPFLSVPRAEFAHRSGLFEQQEGNEEAERPRTATWEVILVKPALVGKARRWTFARDGIEFSALMADKNVLNALHEKTLAIPFAEGVMMQIEVSWKERYDGNAWLPVSDSRRVTRVLNPRVPAGPLPLLADAD